MALPPIVSADDLATWMGVETIDNEDRAEAILSAASTLVRTFGGRAWVDADGEPEVDLTETQVDAVKTVVKLVAERVYQNPRGVTQQSTGPFSRSVASWAAFGLSLTDDEKVMLGGTGQDGIPGLSSVRVIAPAMASGTRHYPWWDDDEVELL